MRSRTRGLLAVLVVAVVGFLAGIALASCGGEEDASPTTTTSESQTTTTATETQTETTEPEQATVVRIRVSGGVPAGGIARPKVDQDDRVVLIVTSDVSDEVHVHGYDLSSDVGPGEPARIAFQATIPGRFEIELENRSVQIAELTVEP